MIPATSTEIRAVLKDHPAGLTAPEIAAGLSSRAASIHGSTDAIDAGSDHVHFMLRLLEAQGYVQGARGAFGGYRVWTLAAAVADRESGDLHADQDVAVDGEVHGNPLAADSQKHDGAARADAVDDALSGFEWMIVEVFGHRRHSGRVREEERFGTKMLRIDVPTVERTTEGGASAVKATAWTTHWYGGAALFSVTPTDELSVLQANLRWAPAPFRLTSIAEDPADLMETEF